MAQEENSRRLLYASATAALGTEAADVLMEHLPPAGGADLARRSDVEHETGLLREVLATLRADMKGEIGTVRAEMAGGFASVAATFEAVRAEMAAMRADLLSEIHKSGASQTRWMLSAFLALGALYSTVNLLGH
jgi:hypothetical protein